MQMNVILKAHQDGHFKTAKLEALLNKEFFIPNLRSKIQSVIDNCIECILMDRKSWKKEGKLHPIPKEPVPLDTLHVDHVGPLTETNKSYNHILAVVDGFTKFIWLFPTKTTTANETVQEMKSITNTFGNPRRIIADRGKAFTSNLFQDFCKDNNIQLIFCTTGMPRANGQIERMHRIVLNSLAKI